MKNLMIATTFFAALAFAPAAFAAGESSTPPKPAATDTGNSTKSNDSSSQTAVSPKKFGCKKGEIIKTVKKSGKSVKTCVKAKAEIAPDEDLYDQGRMLAKEGEYDWALGVLALIKNQDDPRVLNYTGYSNRKAGRLELGITYYRKALAINPDFVLAREYLGEGYVAAGKLDLAKVELNEIEKRCGTTCEEYQDLNKAIQTAL